MKKFYFLLVAMLVSLTAGATGGLAGAFNGWSTTATQTSNTNADGGCYVITVSNWDGGEFKLVVDGGWYSNGTTNIALDDWQTVNSQNNSKNMSLSSEANGKTIQFTIAKDNKNFKAEIVADLPDNITYHLHGSWTGSTWTDVDLTEKDGVWTASDVEVTYASAAFGVKEANNGSQIAWWAATSETTIDADGTYTLADKNTKNFNIAVGIYDFTYNPTSHVLSVVKHTEAPVIPDPTTYKVSYDNGKTAWEEVYVYMWNGDDKNAAWPGVKMSLPEPGSTVWDYSVELTWEPKNVIFNNGSGSQTDDLTFTNGKEYGEAAAPVVVGVWALIDGEDYISAPVTNSEEYADVLEMDLVVDGIATFTVENWGCEGFFMTEQDLVAMEGAVIYTAGTELANGVAVTLAEGVDAMTLPEDAKGKTVTFTYNVNTKKLTASWAAPHYVYLMGINGDWDNGIKAEVSTETNCATWTINGWVEGTGFKVKDGGTWYGYTGDIKKGGWYEMGDTGYDNTKLPVEANGKNVTIKFAADNQNFSVTWEDASAIESIEAVAGAARYFNLQGVEVANPVNGNVYIKVVDGKASKVLVK